MLTRIARWLCVLLSFAGLVTAGWTLLSIIDGYCAENAGECDDDLTTLSYMSRAEPRTSLLANGMTAALVLLLFGDEAVHAALHPRLESDVLRIVNQCIMAFGMIATVVAIVAVRADPSSSLHLEAGIAWLGMRIVHLIALTALAFPESHRAKRCALVEVVFAYARCAVVLVVVILGIILGAQAPSGALSGRTQVAATLAVGSYNLCCYETVLLGDDGGGCGGEKEGTAGARV